VDGGQLVAIVEHRRACYSRYAVKIYFCQASAVVEHRVGGGRAHAHTSRRCFCSYVEGVFSSVRICSLIVHIGESRAGPVETPSLKLRKVAVASRGGSCLSAWKGGVAVQKAKEVVCSTRQNSRQFRERHRTQGKAVLAGVIEDARTIIVSIRGRANRLELRELKVGQFRASLEGVLEGVVVVDARQLRELN